ncbi:MAG: hypothetical protein KatS3mg051_1026 [Anaerolineae bacterium]|nr:MAG: hypothetical protein KatS3mg051_1026 [Anaerolineae bacterium]
MNEIVRVEPSELDTIQRTAKLMLASGFFDASRNPTQALAQVATKILAGRELGFGPWASVSGIHVIQGKPVLSANLMASAVKAHPRYDYRVRKLDDDGCVIEFFQDGESLGTSSFTAEDAKAAGVAGKDVWRRFPRNMLFARALSNGVRWFCPDVFAGNAVYVPGELEESGADDAETAAGIVVDAMADADDADIESGDGGPLPESLDDVEVLSFEDPTSVAQSTNGHHGQRPDWKSPPEAQRWAVEVGACQNEFEARNSWAKIARELHGERSIKPEELPDLYDAFYKRQMEKLARKEAA